MMTDGLFVFLAYALAVVLAGGGGVFLALGRVPVTSWPVKAFAMASLIGAGLLVSFAFPSLTWIGAIYVVVAVAANAVASALRWKSLPVFRDEPLPELLRFELLRPSILRRMAADAQRDSDGAGHPEDARSV
ncbi:hypothetical protein C5E07_03750 [Pseudoclavibacter sp. RFBJ3]|uniref:hypothetical protein n=1 Tax=unclassified Pseudoclavibacter TaxID=2615177 RepID=UPI000CE744A1|nr:MULTISPECIES: hypothetical protein [unclassified Pseudoclavibacter]PPF81022.1 hypothetical protein C5C12_17205 [Pseudoclavibacter sp. RFBJ5]PPF94530.1 hypothetical protein C5E07_03750 [Pseudoclavibacter sp. RFBJ3]PPF99638.1 hypothetical protein C5C19_05390 [Pseudoclavibacter sp. RFBH5]PPG25832.1 hypothetical protein C5E13_02450 [Pseudoclavibacter sp. RFBI4]